MAKPPRSKRINLDYECDAFGCRPKGSLTKGKPGSSSVTRKKSGGPVPRFKFDEEVTQMNDKGSPLAPPSTDVGLDIAEVGKYGKEKQLFRGTYQEAQNPGSLAAAAKASSAFTPQNFPKFQMQSEQNLLVGGADPRTISPTAKPGQLTKIGQKPMNKADAAKLRFLMGPKLDILNDQKIKETTRYRTNLKTGERIPVKKVMYTPDGIVETNLESGMSKITDRTGKVSRNLDPTIKVTTVDKIQKPSSQSITETKSTATERDVKKAMQTVAKKKKPGYFSKEAKRARQRKRYYGRGR